MLFEQWSLYLNRNQIVEYLECLVGSWVVVFIFLLHSLQPQILILCLKSQINSEGEAGVVCFGNINSSPAADGKIFSYKIIPQGKYFYSKIFFLAWPEH